MISLRLFMERKKYGKVISQIKSIPVPPFVDFYRSAWSFKSVSNAMVVIDGHNGAKIESSRADPKWQRWCGSLQSIALFSFLISPNRDKTGRRRHTIRIRNEFSPKIGSVHSMRKRKVLTISAFTASH